jgi:hypothetical protein
VRLGAAPIQSESENKTEAIVASTIYDEVRANQLAGYPWSFALSKITPAQFGSPRNDFTDRFDVVYQVPAEAMRVLRLTSGAEFIVTENNELWTDDSQASIWYIRDVPESEFKPWFVTGMVKELASAFALAVTGDNSRAEFFAALARDQWSISKNDDSQQSTPLNFEYMRLIRTEPEVMFN